MVQALKKLFIVIAILILMGYVGNLLLDNPYVHRLIRQIVNDQLKEYTHLTVKFEAVSAKFLPPGLDVYGVEILNKDPKPIVLFKASHVKLHVSAMALLLSRKEILDLELNEPSVTLPLPPVETLLRMEKFPDWGKDTGLPVWPPEGSLPFYRIAVTNGKLAAHVKDGENEKGKEKEAEKLRVQAEGLDFELLHRSWNDMVFTSKCVNSNLFIDDAHVVKDLAFEVNLRKVQDVVTSDFVQLNSAELNTLGHWNIAFEKIAAKGKEPARLKGLVLSLSHLVRNADMAILGRFLNTDKSAGPISGKVETQLHIPLDGRPLVWEIEGSATSNGATLSGFKFLDSSIDFAIREDGMSFDKALVKKGEKVLVKGSGFLGFKDEGRMHFDLQPQDIELKDLLSILQVDDFEAIETKLAPSRLQLSGRSFPFELKLSGDLILDQLTFPFVKDLPERYETAPTCEMQSEIVIDADKVDVQRASGHCFLAAAGSELNVQGKFHYSTAQGMSLALASPDLDATLLQHFVKLRSEGKVDAKIAIKGPYDDLVIQGEVASPSLSVAAFALTDIDAAFRFPLKKNQIEINRLEASAQEGGFLNMRNARIGFDEGMPFEADIIAKKLPPEFFSEGFKELLDDVPLSFGLRSLEGQLRGKLLQPFRYEGKVHVSVHDLLWDKQKILSEASGSYVGDDDARSLEGLYLKLDTIEAKVDVNVRDGKAKALGTGSRFERLGLRKDSIFKFSLHTLTKPDDEYRSNSVDKGDNQLASLPFVGKLFAEHDIGGVIGLHTELEGPLDELQGKIEGSLDRPHVWGIPIPSIAFSGFVDGSRLQIPEFRHAGNSLLGRLNIDFGKSGMPYDWYIYLNQFDMRAVLGKIFADDPRNFAYLSAEWTMAGKLEEFWKSRGELVFNQLRSKLFRNLGSRTSSIELNSDEAIRIKIAPEQWTFEDRKSLKLKGDYFDLELSTGDNRLPDHLDLRLQGSVKLDILKNFTNLAETARGELILDGYLKGSIEDPDFSMRIRERRLDPFNLKDWNPVSIGLVNYGPALSGVSLDVEVRSDRLLVHRFKASKGREGSIEIAGELLFEESGNDVSRLMVKLNQIEFNRLSIPVLKSADVIVSGDLTISGNSFPFNLGGNLKIDRFQSIGSFDLRREIVSSLYESKLNNAAVGGGSQQTLFNLDIGLQADRSIIVKNKSIEAILSANLRLKGTDSKPLLLGQVIADQGTFNYRRSFKLTQAVISFDEPVSPPNPRLDISGETIINPYKVTVQITGDVTNPKMNLTSDPPSRDDGTPLTNLDIVLLISTGKIPDTANKTAEKASVNELFSSFLVFAEEPIEKLFDLSGQTVIREVYIDSYISETDERPVTRLNVPFNLLNAANAVVQVDDESNAKLSFEYPIHEGITFTGSLDKRPKQKDETANNLPADTGFDLKFRFGFD